MSVSSSGAPLSMVLAGILLACVLGLIVFVTLKLGGRPKTLKHRGLKIRMHPELPPGKIILTDADWQPIGETGPDRLDTTSLPRGCAAAWLSAEDFAMLAMRKGQTRQSAQPRPPRERSADPGFRD